MDDYPSGEVLASGSWSRRASKLKKSRAVAESGAAIPSALLRGGWNWRMNVLDACCYLPTLLFGDAGYSQSSLSP